MLIINDPAAQQVMVAWTCSNPPFKDFRIRPNDSAASSRGRLWSEVGPINFEELEKLSGVPRTKCERIFYRLQAVDLIFPDGTISNLAQQLLSGRVMANIKGFIAKGKTNGRA